MSVPTKCDHLPAIPPKFPSPASFNLSASQSNVCPQFDVPLCSEVGPVCMGTCQDGSSVPEVPRAAVLRCTWGWALQRMDGRGEEHSQPLHCWYLSWNQHSAILGSVPRKGGSTELLTIVSPAESGWGLEPRAAQPCVPSTIRMDCWSTELLSSAAAQLPCRGTAGLCAYQCDTAPITALISCLCSLSLFCPAGYEPSCVPGLWAPPGAVTEPWEGFCKENWLWRLVLETCPMSLRRPSTIHFGGKCLIRSTAEMGRSKDFHLAKYGQKVVEKIVLTVWHLELKGTPTWTVEKLRGWGALGSVTLAASLQIHWFPGWIFPSSVGYNHQRWKWKLL